MTTATAKALPIGSTQPTQGLLPGIVRKHLRAHNNSKPDAMRDAVEEILSHEKTLNGVLNEVVSAACDEQLRRALMHQRERAVTAVRAVTEDAKKRAADGAASLLDFPMRSGLRLHQAVREQVDETASHYMTSGSTSVQRGLWLQAVSTKLPDDATPVGRVLNAQALTKLFNASVKKVKKMGLPYVG